MGKVNTISCGIKNYKDNTLEIKTTRILHKRLILVQIIIDPTLSLS